MNSLVLCSFISKEFMVQRRKKDERTVEQKEGRKKKGGGKTGGIKEGRREREGFLEEYGRKEGRRRG